MALVTGGSRGIGAAIARRLELEGAAVSITYSTSTDEANGVIENIARGGNKGFAIWADAGDAVAVKSAVGLTVERFSRLDGLVNNAAMFRIGLIDEFALKDIDQMLAINVKSLFVATQEALRFMGRITTKMNSLQGIAVFVRVAQLRSFSEAARQLGVAKSESVISSRIQQLEEIGMPLLMRNTRRRMRAARGPRQQKTPECSNRKSKKRSTLRGTPRTGIPASSSGPAKQVYDTPEY